MAKQVDWLYKPANINHTDYQEELQKLRKIIIPDLDNTPQAKFYPVVSEIVKEHCPNLCEKFREWGLYDRMGESAFILVRPGGHYAIHRDISNWRTRNVALNMPILNCDNSYTVFYDAVVTKNNLYGELGESVYVKHALKVEEDTAKEIGRCPSNIPHWLNVYQPHAPVVEHDKLRIAFSTRFWPEIFDYLEDGRFDSMLVK